MRVAVVNRVIALHCCLIQCAQLRPFSATQSTCRPFQYAPIHAMSRSVTLTPAQDSVASFHSILNDYSVKSQVRQISLRTLKDPETDHKGEHRRRYTREPWLQCVARLAELHNLEEVHIRFGLRVSVSTHFIHEPVDDVSFRTKTLNTLFNALDHVDSKINTLSIDNLQDLTVGVYNTESFQNVRSRLKSLHLKIAMEWSEASPEGDIDIPEKHAFFDQELTTHWLRPLQGQLTHLSLYAEDFWGVYPRWDCRQLHFPRLRSLSLGRWSLAHDWQIDWLLAHGDTLEELLLDDCPIAHALQFDEWQHRSLQWGAGEASVGTDGWKVGQIFPSMRWSTVLLQFGTGLKRLKRFGIGYGEWDPVYGAEYDLAFDRRYTLQARLVSTRYCMFDYGTLPSPWIQDFSTQERGESATSEEDIQYDCVWMMEDDNWDLDTQSWTVPPNLQYPQEREREQKALDALMKAVAQNRESLR
ncbi:hypothetical protein BKA63DRAFT_81461 [Paraphoma chrysanthemicola]|nr:hypothetical protein BKA63DRAFT_81461 [Paraphoma chrysanthemicola]